MIDSNLKHKVNLGLDNNGEDIKVNWEYCKKSNKLFARGQKFEFDMFFYAFAQVELEFYLGDCGYDKANQQKIAIEYATDTLGELMDKEFIDGKKVDNDNV